MSSDDRPLLSVVIANYNYGRFLGDAIESLLSQSFQGFELIVVDGGSTDNSVEVIRKYQDRIAWWCTEPDAGQSAAFNKGFSHATGRFLTWLNADDVFFPGALAAVVKEINRHPKGEWFVGSTSWVDADLRIKRVFVAHRFSILRGYFASASACGPSSFFTRRLLDAAGGIDETMHYAMDNDLWHRFFRKCHVRYWRTTANVWAYRIHEDSKLSGADVSTKQKALDNRARAHQEGLELARRYPLSVCWVRPIALLFSFSVVDKIRAIYRTHKMKGRKVNEC